MEDVSHLKVGFRFIAECRGGREWVVCWGGGYKIKTKECERKEKRASEQHRTERACISFLDSCLLDDRIKESFNMTSVLYSDINTPHTPL